MRKSPNTPHNPHAKQEMLQHFIQRAERVSQANHMPIILGGLSLHYELDARHINAAYLFSQENGPRQMHHVSLAIAPAGTHNHDIGWRAGIVFDRPDSGMPARGFSVLRHAETLTLYETQGSIVTERGEIGYGNPFPCPEEASEATIPQDIISQVLTHSLTNPAFRQMKQAQVNAAIAASPMRADV